MTTTLSEPTVLSSDELRVLRFIREHDGASEGEIMGLLFPEPVWPQGAEVGSEAAAVWFDQNVEWQAKAYGGTFHRRDGTLEPETPYGQTYSAARFAITQRLTKLGLIREHNNGFNCYSWDCTPAGKGRAA